MSDYTFDHAHGGKVTVKAIAHDTHDGVPGWHFVGDVDYQDGEPPARDTDIAVHCVCGAPEQVNPLFSQLAEYLREHGTWLDEPMHLKNGYLVSWQPHQPTGRKELAE